MKTIKINESIVCYDDYKLEEKLELKNFVESEELNNLVNSINETVIIVLGGDGTMLRAIKENYEKKLPFLGINFGHKGFLLNDSNFIQPGFEYEKRKYPMLKARVKLAGNKYKEDIAVNEIDIRSASGKMIELDLTISGENRINLRGDGMLVSTPAGSTAYNKNLGGPVMPHRTPSFIITPKAPDNGQGSVIVNDDEIIEINNKGRLHPIQVNCDGRSLTEVEGENISVEVKKYEREVEFIIAKSYLSAWDNKVLQEQGFNTK